jgi:anti-anti-sigma factor
MQIDSTDVDGAMRVALAGRLDTAGIGAGELGFTALVVGADKPVIVDLERVSFIASLAVRMFISAARSLSRKGGKLVLYGANDAVAEIIETMGLDEIVAVAHDEAGALALARG